MGAGALSLGVGVGLSALGPALGAAHDPDNAVAAWGDSLTYGWGATDPDTDNYATVAAGLLGRASTRLGVGGQTSTQVAARQGGVPIEVTLDGNEIPAFEDCAVSYGFEIDKGDFLIDPGSTGEVSGGRLIVSSAGGQSVASVLLPQSVPLGTRIAVRVHIELLSGTGPVRVICHDAAVAAWGQQRDLVDGTNTFDLYSTNGTLDGMMFFSPGASSFALDNVTISYAGVEVTVQSVNVLFNSGSYTGYEVGSILGIGGVMTTDNAGNWTFFRLEPGDAAAAAGSRFLPDNATTHRTAEQWLWAGRNGADGGHDVEADIAAMVSWIGHGHYRVLGVVTGKGDNGAAVATIEALNATLAATHGARFIDVLAILKAENDGSANDLSDVAAGWVPRSLRFDGVHLNTAGYAVVGQAVADSYG